MAVDRISEEGGCEAPRSGYRPDGPGPWSTRSLMEKAAFTRANLFGVRVIMVIMCVPVEELLC
jgi:hypothetical protein